MGITINDDNSKVALEIKYGFECRILRQIRMHGGTPKQSQLNKVQGHAMLIFCSI